jgi:mannose-6-phosphate isomerase-like protein (cupin superfamily)
MLIFCGHSRNLNAAVFLLNESCSPRFQYFFLSFFIMPSAIKINEKFAAFSEHWTPKIIGDLNENFVKIAKLKDEFVWHNHAHEDELFLVMRGTLIMDFRDKTVEVQPGEMLIVPKGVEHRPRTNGEEVWTLLVEPKSTLHTGNAQHDATVAIADQERI